jgi:hypothetical protein
VIGKAEPGVKALNVRGSMKVMIDFVKFVEQRTERAHTLRTMRKPKEEQCPMLS